MEIREIVDQVGGQAALADICGVTQPTVSYWVTKNRQLSAEHALKVEAKSKLSRHQLRRDIFGDQPTKAA